MKIAVMMASVAGNTSAAKPQSTAGRDQLAEAPRSGGQHRDDCESTDTGKQHPPVTEPIPEVAAGEQQAREDERVRVDDPLQTRDSRIQVPRQRRQRDVDDRVVDHHEQFGKTQGSQREPAQVDEPTVIPPSIGDVACSAGVRHEL